MTTAKLPAPPLLLPLAELPYIHARGQQNTTLLESDYVLAEGAGVVLHASCDGKSLVFWLSEADWIAWLAPQLAIPALSAVEEDIRTVLAEWTLSAINHWLLQQQLPACHAVSLQAFTINKPTHCWCITFRQAAQALPLRLCLWEVEPSWLQAVLAGMQPNPETLHTFALGLGWCYLPAAAWQQSQPGDAFLLQGIETDRLDIFWLQPPQCPGRIQLLGHDRAIVLPQAPGPAPAMAESLCLSVNAGSVRIAATDLAQWTVTQQLTVTAVKFPTLQLTTEAGCVAQGNLIQWGQQWAFQLVAR